MKRAWILLVLGALSIAAGIVSKRVFDVREHLIWWHIFGAILLIAGAMMATRGKSR